MNSEDPYNITYRRQRFINSDRGEEELEDIELGDIEYQFRKGKETRSNDDKTTFNSLISTIKELTIGKKEMMSTFRQMTEKNGPPHTFPCFPIVIGYPLVVVGSTYIEPCRSIPIYTTSLPDLPCLNS